MRGIRLAGVNFGYARMPIVTSPVDVGGSGGTWQRPLTSWCFAEEDATAQDVLA